MYPNRLLPSLSFLVNALIGSEIIDAASSGSSRPADLMADAALAVLSITSVNNMATMDNVPMAATPSPNIMACGPARSAPAAIVIAPTVVIISDIIPTTSRSLRGSVVLDTSASIYTTDAIAAANNTTVSMATHPFCMVLPAAAIKYDAPISTVSNNVTASTGSQLMVSIPPTNIIKAATPARIATVSAMNKSSLAPPSIQFLANDNNMHDPIRTRMNADIISIFSQLAVIN